jgi:hypothetical protein
MQTNRLSGIDYGNAPSAIQPSVFPDAGDPLIGDRPVKIRLAQEPGFWRFLWTDRAMRAAVLAGGITLVAVAGSVGVTYAVTHNLGATFGVLGAGSALIGCVANCIHNRADALDDSKV